MKEKIICAAIWYKDYNNNQNLPVNIDSGLVIYGPRHHNCIFTYYRLTGDKTFRKDIQGFITTEDRFVDRREAAEIAFNAGQINETTDCLFSEDLY